MNRIALRALRAAGIVVSAVPRNLQHSCAIVLCSVALLAGLSPLSAAEGLQIKRIYVPAGKPDVWPEGFRPLGAEQYRKLLDSVPARGNAPETAWIERAEYSAVVAGDRLVDGRMAAEIHGAANNPELPDEEPRWDLLRLDPLNLAITELQWSKPDSSGTAAVWGTSPNGELALLVDPAARTLDGRWSLKGRRFSDGVEYDVRVPPAAVSEIRLEIPETELLTSSAGDVIGPEPATQPGLRTWRVQLGSATRCRLKVTPGDNRDAIEPLVVVEQEHSCVVGDDEVRLQTTIRKLEVHQAPLKQLTFHLPAEVQIDSITYGGDAKLSWRSDRNGSFQRIIVEFPKPLKGRARPIRVSGFAPTRLAQVWTVPEISLANAYVLSQRTGLKIEEPLEIRSLEPVGYRQTDADASSFTFERFLDDGRIKIEVDRPRPRAAAAIVTHVAVDVEGCTMTSDVTWQTQFGRLYEVRCAVSPHWEITSVRAESESGMSLMTSWDVYTDVDGRRIFLLQLPKALSPESSQFVQIEATRTSTVVADPLPLPVLSPIDCPSVERLIVLSHPKSFVAAVEPSSGFERVGESELAELLTALAPHNAERPGSSGERLALHTVDPAATGAVVIRSRDPLFDAVARLSVQLDRGRTIETTVLTVSPKLAAVERLIVYFNSEGPPPNWKAADDTEFELDVQRLPAERHADWKLPSSGELWEIRLSAPQQSEFQFSVNRSAETTYSPRPALVFLPTAEHFSGYVTLRTSTGLNVHVEADGLQAAGTGADDTRVPAEDSLETVQTWQYNSVENALRLHVLDDIAKDRVAPPVSLHLRSLVKPGGAGDDVHWATYQIDAESRPRPFRFSLEKPAVLVNVRLNGSVVRVSDDAGEHALPMLPEGRSNVVEIEYRCPSERSFLHDSRRVIVPRCAFPVLSFEWEFALPADTRPSAEPQSVSLSEAWPDITWTERLFGPLGRAGGSSVFNPFHADAWLDVFDPGSPSSTAGRETNDSAFPPSGWTIVRAHGPRLPDELVLGFWNIGRIRWLAWTVVLGCLVMGFSMRLGRFRNRGTVAAVALSFSGIAAVLVPSAYAEIFGGCFAAALIATLVPRSVLLRPKRRSPDPDRDPVSTTIHLPGGSSIPVLLLASVLAASAIAQEAAVNRTPGEAGSAGRGRDSQAELPVLIPVDEDLHPEENAPFVYVTDEFIERLRALDAQQQRSVDYLIESAAYQIAVTDLHAAALEARYKVAVLSKQARTSVALPITNAELVLPEACLINGQPQEVLPGPEGRGFVVELKQVTELSTTDAGQSGSETESTEEIANAGSRTARTYEIVLRMQPRVNTLPGGGSVKIGIPRVAESRLAVEFSDDYQTVNVATEAGELDAERTGRVLTARLGQTDELEVEWVTADNPVRAELEARVFRFVEMHPGSLEYRYRNAYTVRRGKVDFMEWDVPEHTIVRNVADGHHWTLVPPTETARLPRLRIEFDTPRSDEFDIDVSLTVPIRSVDGHIRVPIPSPLASVGDRAEIRMDVNEVGLSAASGFEAVPRNADSARVPGVAAGSLLQQAAAAAKISEPQFVYQPESTDDLQFRLTPRPPRRLVLLNQEVRIHRNQIDWKMTAEVTIQQAAVFQHRLQIDPRINIESVSVKQGGAERLVNSARDGEQLTLFLNGRGTDLQDVVISGSLPLPTPAETLLPYVLFDDAKLGDSRLLVYYAPGVAVELLNSEAISLDEGASKPSAEDSPDMLLGRYRLREDSPPPKIRVLRSNVAARVDSATILQRGASNGEWNLVTVFRLRDLRSSVRELRLNIPAALSNVYELDAAGKEQLERKDDGSVDVIVRPSSLDGSGFPVRLTAPVAAPSGREWLLPVVSAKGSQVLSNFVCVPADLSWKPRDASGKDPAAVDVPDWVLQSIQSTTEKNRWRAYRIDAGAPSLLIDLSGTETETPRVPLVQTRMWFDSDGEVLGNTEIVVIPNAGRSLDLDWPVGTQFRYLFVDGEATKPLEAHAQGVSIPLQPGLMPRTAILFWSRNEGHGPPRLGKFTQECPRVSGHSSERSIVRVEPPPDLQLLQNQGFVAIDAIEHATYQLEGLLSAVESYNGNAAAASPVWNSLLAVDEWLRVQWARASVSLDVPSQREPLWKRFVECHERVNTLRNAVSETTPTEDKSDAAMRAPDTARRTFDMLLPAPAANRSAVYGLFPKDSPASRFTVWTIDHVIVYWALVILGIVAVIPIAGRLLAMNLHEWLDAHKSAAWALLGLMWWACLEPSWLGLLLLLMTGVHAVRRRTVDTEEPSPDDFELHPA